jgi:sulfur carrier protein
MIKILLNGEPMEVAEALSVDALLESTDQGQRRVAVEVNREIVPRSLRAARVLHDGDRVEIVQAMGGG